MSERKSNFSEAWWKRKAVYVIIAVIGLVLSGFGFVTQDQVDAFTASPLLATLVGTFAAAKTHPGSDSTVTADDMARAAANSAAQFVNQIDTYGKHAAKTADKAARSVAEHYKNRGA